MKVVEFKTEESIIRKTLGLISSMVRSGENHSKSSEKALNNALKCCDNIKGKYVPLEDVEKMKGLLEWTLNVCNEIQGIKTYATRFPETANLGHEIKQFLKKEQP